MLSKEYLAGLFDGEGCVSITLKDDGCNFTISIAQQKPIVLVLIFSQYPEGNIEIGSEKSKCNYFRLYNNSAKRFLEDILPFLVVKKRQVEIAFEFMKVMSKRDGGKKLTEEEKIQRSFLVKQLQEDKNSIM